MDDETDSTALASKENLFFDIAMAISQNDFCFRGRTATLSLPPRSLEITSMDGKSNKCPLGPDQILF
ncbi:MAG TPA: hypothetical protein VN380_24595 [Thermoanaerobaculia bacterium]|nr:hypothetical protein [Thermoanaerobaculia bacterium]